MALSLTLFALLFDAAAVAVLGLVTWVVTRSPEKPSARPFAALVAALTASALLVAVTTLAELVSLDPVSGTAELLQLGVALFVPGIWLVYVLGYAGRGTGLTRRRIAMLAGIGLPPLFAAAALGVGFLVFDLSTTTLEPIILPFVAFELFYLFGIWVYAVYLLYGLVRRTNRVSGTQATAIILGVSAPYLVPMLGIGAHPLDGVTLGFLLSGAVLLGSVRRYPLLTGFPKTDYVARTRVVESLQEGVVVLDYEDHVLDVNATATRLFGRDRGAVVGAPIHSLLEGLDHADLSPGATGTVRLRTTRGRRQFRYSVSAVDDAATDGDTPPVARALVLRDVTDRQTREQRLTVLNRVLRHNLRNQLDVVLAHADRIEDDRTRETIRDTVTDLLELGETARSAEEIMRAAADAPERVPLPDVVASAVADHRDRPGSVTVDCPDTLSVTTHRTVVEAALAELLDNAFTHSDRSDPSVEVGVRTTDDAVVEITVADDGPGIPDRERAVLDSGTETQLEHGLGMGLWSINWAVTRVGGDLSVADNDPRGTVVTVRLYGTDPEF